ncbi:MAG TPA: hypothetical protein VII51_04690 [Gaiellaceae bacterium]
MGLLDKAKAAGQQAATKAREGVEDVQAKKDLHLAYVELGKQAFDLVEAGTLDQPELTAHVETIRDLKAKLADEPAVTV